MRIDEYDVDIFELDFSNKDIGHFINKFIPLNWIGIKNIDETDQVFSYRMRKYRKETIQQLINEVSKQFYLTQKYEVRFVPCRCSFVVCPEWIEEYKKIKNKECINAITGIPYGYINVDKEYIEINHKEDLLDKDSGPEKMIALFNGIIHEMEHARQSEVYFDLIEGESYADILKIKLNSELTNIKARFYKFGLKVQGHPYMFINEFSAPINRALYFLQYTERKAHLFAWYNTKTLLKYFQECGLSVEKAKERNDSLYEGAKSLNILINRCNCSNPILEVDNCINALNQKDIMMQSPDAQKELWKIVKYQAFAISEYEIVDAKAVFRKNRILKLLAKMKRLLGIT